MGVGLFVAGKRIIATDLSNAATEVLYHLAPEQALDVAKRQARWNETNEPQFDEGKTNGRILALFLLGTNAADREPVVIEASRRAREMSSALDSLPTKTNERGKVATVLRQMLFYDRIKKLR